MVQPVMVGAQEHEVVQFSGAAVFPVLDVVGVQTAGRPAAGHRAGGVAIFQGTTQPAVDRACGAAGTDGLAVAVEPHLTRGVTRKVLALGVGEQRSQMQLRDTVFDVEVHDHRGALPVGPARRRRRPIRIRPDS